MRLVAERNLASVRLLVRQYYTDRTAWNRSESRDELQARVAAGSVLVLDVRPAWGSAAGHLPGAVNIPSSNWPSGLTELRPASTSSPAEDLTACMPMTR